jgi:CHASE2 domain-containing sensor protein
MKCRPKLIGVHFLYIGEKTRECDTLLRAAIKRSDKVILAEGFQDGEPISSDNYFKEVAMFSCVSGLAQSDDGVTDYYYRAPAYGDKWHYSFPFHVALQYDKTKATQLASKSHSSDYPINYYKKLEEFKVFTPADILDNCSEIEGKIILIGDLSTDEGVVQTRVTEKSSNKSFATVVIANIILDILKDLDSKDVEIKKYNEFIRQKEMKEN